GLVLSELLLCKLSLCEPGSNEGGGAENDLSPTGDGGEGGGALHGVANEAEISGGIGVRGGHWHGVRRAVGAAEGSVLARVEHYENRVVEDECIVKYFVMQSIKPARFAGQPRRLSLRERF